MMCRDPVGQPGAGRWGALSLGRDDALFRFDPTLTAPDDLVATPWSALIGFGLVGLGLANVIPVVFSAAGRVPGVHAGTALATVAITGYGAYLVGPPAIGLAAGVAGLPIALVILVACCVVITAQANALHTSAITNSTASSRNLSQNDSDT